MKSSTEVLKSKEMFTNSCLQVVSDSLFTITAFLLSKISASSYFKTNMDMGKMHSGIMSHRCFILVNVENADCVCVLAVLWGCYSWSTAEGKTSNWFKCVSPPYLFRGDGLKFSIHGVHRSCNPTFKDCLGSSYMNVAFILHFACVFVRMNGVTALGTQLNLG